MNRKSLQRILNQHISGKVSGESGCAASLPFPMEKIMGSPLKQNRAKGTFVVINVRGIHTRPATEIVKTANRFQSSIKLYYRNGEANAKSLLSILMLAAEKGAKIRVEAEGEDASEAVNALLKLAKDQFNMSY